MGHDHEHHHLPPRGAGIEHRRRLAWAFALAGGFFVVELVGGLATGSLALLSDAGHMLTDVGGLGMALAAMSVNDRHLRSSATGQHTYGLYRLEILAALINALVLSVVAIWVIAEAATRIGQEPDVHVGGMFVIGLLGLVVNLIGFVLLRQGARESMNIEGAYLEVIADAVGSVGVVAAAAALHLWGWAWVDPVTGAAVGLWILPRTLRLARRAVRILLQSAPPDLDLDRVQHELTDIDGVIEVHDLHVWSLTPGMEAATAHLVVEVGIDTHGVLDQARDLLHSRFQIEHATIQIEPEDHTGCDDVSW